jgi:hypothetical protein
MNFRSSAALCATALLLSGRAQALTILLDYSDDITTDNFFNTHPVAKASLEKARNDIQSAITSTLGAIVNDITTGTSGTATATYDFSFGYTNPSTGAAQTIALSTLATNQVRIFVGMRELAGTTLGQGGPGSQAISAGGSAINAADWPGAVNAANAAATAERLRGGGPTINALAGEIVLGGVPGQINVPYGSSIANLWFDNDTNNDSVTDNDTQLNAFWHFDSGTSVAAGHSDFYSVAMHEMLHALGVGSSQSWTADVSGGVNWLGSNVINVLGSGNNAVTGGHIAAGLNSPSIVDGTMQEALMSPAITVGTRKQITQLDLAFLRDIGWQTIPEPSTGALSLAVAGGLLARRRRRA